MKADSNYSAVNAFEQGCIELAKQFAQRYDFPRQFYWVGDNIGDICSFGDYFFSTETMKVALDNNISESELMDWYYYTIDSENYNLFTPNLQSWIKGCPRANKHQLEVLRELDVLHLLKSNIPRIGD